MQEKQTLFSGGLNNRLPAHMIPDGFSQDVKNADLTHGDFRPEKGEGTDSSDPAGSPVLLRGWRIMGWRCRF